MSLENWILKFNMDCYSSLEISLPGMMFFTGFAISAPILSYCSDKYGRKIIYVISLYVVMSAMIVILLLPGDEKKYFYVLVSMFLMCGVASGGRSFAGYCLMTELLPESWKSIAGTTWGCFEGMIYVYLTIYYRFICINWVPTVLFGATLQGITATLILLFLPESPKWLYEQK